MERKNAWELYNEKQLEELEKLSKDYRVFLDRGKTERECILQTIEMAEQAGYKNLDTIIQEKKEIEGRRQGLSDLHEKVSHFIPYWNW